MKVLLGMSGGLDSTYAAAKLIDMGYTVEGAVLVMHDYTDTDSARESADSLGIPLHVIDCKEAFEKCVVTDFIDNYLMARTPNPCVICNSDVKFRCLYQYAMDNGFDKIATGHYARILEIKEEGSVRYAFMRSDDEGKDQTYVLWRLPQDILASLLLPLGNETKRCVRDRAKRMGLRAAERDESQEICFIPDNDHASYIEARIGPSKHGHFIDTDGKIIGEHNGVIRYTVGQRKGLGIAMGKRVYVTNINVADNTVMLSDEDVFSDRFTVSGAVFSGIEEPACGAELALSVKQRYLAPPIKCILTYLGDGRATVALKAPIRAVTPGQSAVFYDGDLLVLGGFINT